jgi:aminoacrylate hydrolase
MAMVDIGDAELYVEEHGAGFPVFFVAGLGGRGSFWKQQIAAFAEHFRVILHDHRGTGQSTPNLLVTGAQQMAGDLTRLMETLGIERAHLVGHSTGGAIGQHIALQRPELLERLVLSCSWPGPDSYFTQLFHTRRRVLVDCGPEAYLNFGNFLGTPSWYLQPQMNAADSFMNERMSAFPGTEVELSRIDAVLAHDLREDLHRIATPTLCIGAKDDQITPAAFTEELAERIGGAQLRILPHGGHFCPIAAAAQYNPVVLDFLKG